MRAADALMESLKAEGVENIFGIPGGANLPTYDALVDAGFRHIQVRHEQGGGHAAEGYAKAWSRRSPTRCWTRCRPSSSPARCGPS